MPTSSSTSLPAPPQTITPTEQTTFSDFLFTHPVIQPYDPILTLTSSLPAYTLLSFVSLVGLTSSAAYAASKQGWHPKAKAEELRQKGMRAVTLRFPPGGDTASSAAATDVEDGAGAVDVAALLAYLPVTEHDPDARPPLAKDFLALYIYEIHVHPSLQGQGLGGVLMQLAEELGVSLRVRKCMLTVFTSNERAIRFYEREDWDWWDEEVVEVVRSKRLRGRKVEAEKRGPEYVILAKDVGGEEKDNEIAGLVR